RAAATRPQFWGGGIEGELALQFHERTLHDLSTPNDRALREPRAAWSWGLAVDAGATCRASLLGGTSRACTHFGGRDGPERATSYELRRLSRMALYSTCLPTRGVASERSPVLG